MRAKARKIGPGRQSITGMVANGDDPIEFESTLERDYVVLTKFREPDAEIQDQPEKVWFINERGRKTKYVPDFLVRHASGYTELVEVKPRKILTEQKDFFAARFDAAREFARKRGWEFQIYSEIHIRIPMLRNAHFLTPYRSQKVKPDLCARLLLTVKRGRLPVSELIAAVAGNREERLYAIPQVWHLVSTGRLSVDLNVLVSQSSMISLTQAERH
ncbi:TnsA endonuclease N-terminal domain-containing protein [Ferrovibrio sp.]|uniref:TnsA endonuclease N-terminal domain-containing protein n=1 Tax=Ferrovibrio sp. TaxID=1917215 RepID=UPI001B597903|nr:TnsA endonuclease N-terminal domain-containing protein [Ferrovibrio sp.]MBP7065181.1 TnsA endonuclease N-terminal domain-containing protein [Ferrovibrio sp.]